MVGDYEEASASYKRAIMCEPSDPMIHLNLGIVYQLQERYDDAVGSYQRSIALAPNNAEVYSRLGSVYTAQGKRQEAVTAYKNAVRIKLLTDTKSEPDT
jgi:tetratricopeptide (TPR) repeat protein